MRGGGQVTNLGEKRVAATDSEGKMFKLTFQCADKITRNLAAASKICESGKGVWLGPGPYYKAYIIHRPDQVKIGNGPRTPLGLRNGVYEFNLRELMQEPKVSTGRDLCAGIPLAAEDPYEVEEDILQPAASRVNDDDKGCDGDDGGNGEDVAPVGCEMCSPKEQAPVHLIKDPGKP